MNDIVERLRSTLSNEPSDDALWDRVIEERHDAALEIERLTNALREIAYHPTGGVGCNPVQFVLAAREALKAKP